MFVCWRLNFVQFQAVTRFPAHVCGSLVIAGDTTDSEIDLSLDLLVCVCSVGYGDIVEVDPEASIHSLPSLCSEAHCMGPRSPRPSCVSAPRAIKFSDCLSALWLDYIIYSLREKAHRSTQTTHIHYTDSTTHKHTHSSHIQKDKVKMYWSQRESSSSNKTN